MERRQRVHGEELLAERVTHAHDLIQIDDRAGHELIDRVRFMLD